MTRTKTTFFHVRPTISFEVPTVILSLSLIFCKIYFILSIINSFLRLARMEVKGLLFAYIS